jgi:hypothetical protein
VNELYREEKNKFTVHNVEIKYTWFTCKLSYSFIIFIKIFLNQHNIFLTFPFFLQAGSLNITRVNIMPVKKNSNCESSGVVYIINCKLCNKFYVGETSKKAKIRIWQHLRSITNFLPFNKSTEIAEHFNLIGHRISRDFKFCIFTSDLMEKERRLDCETDIRHIIDMFKTTLNVKKPNHMFIKHLSFSNF